MPNPIPDNWWNIIIDFIKIFTHPSVLFPSTLAGGFSLESPQVSCCLGLFLFCLVLFYGISTLVGYLMPNPFLYI